MMFAAPLAGEPVDLFVLSPVPASLVSTWQGKGQGKSLYCESSVHIHT